MVGAARQAGVYLNRQANVARRVGIGITPPSGDEWVRLSDDPNAGLLALREAARQQNLSGNADAIQWE
ncbi:MAG: hypothetical protein NTZ05_15275 [Chloroflexi bacterium]|nr:hypothetical protein [Chloroflexota bacterium]